MPIAFSVSNCDMYDLCHHYTQLSFHQRSTCVCASPSIHRVHEGWWQWFRVMQAKHSRKRNGI